jgi:hypothetical protein
MKTLSGLICAGFILFAGLPQSRAASSICDAVAGNLVTNCGFETGDFTGWTVTGNDTPLSEGVLYGVEGQDPVDNIYPNSGNYQAFFADLDANATTLAQTLATSITTDTAYIDFYLAQDTTPDSSSEGNNFLDVTFGSTTLIDALGTPVQSYTEYSYAVTPASPTSATTALSITLGNGLGEWLLDDVSVVVTPEPSAWTLALGGVLLGLGMFARKRMKRGAAL